MTNSHLTNEYYLKQLKPFGKFCRHLRILRIYRNGSGIGMLFNYWNPLSYPIILVCLVLSVLIYGIMETYKDRANLGLVMDPYFKEHPDQLIWI